MDFIARREAMAHRLQIDAIPIVRTSNHEGLIDPSPKGIPPKGLPGARRCAAEGRLPLGQAWKHDDPKAGGQKCFCRASHRPRRGEEESLGEER